jgi:D-alanyl-D-alanine carboxypeptidase (penicillin-binding protein 5/6)
VIGVELGGATRDEVDGDVGRVLDSVTAGFHQLALGHEGDVVGTYSTPWGAGARMVLGSSPSVLTWSNTKVVSSMTTTPLTTGRRGEKVGTVTWTAGPNTVKAPIVLEHGIAPPSAWWRLTHPFELGR